MPKNVQRKICISAYICIFLCLSLGAVSYAGGLSARKLSHYGLFDDPILMTTDSGTET